MKLTFVRFEAKHFPEYRSWYADPDLNRVLGPMDQEWLDCVTRATDGCEYAVSDDTGLVAVVGIKFPTPEHPTYAITDFAVKPALRGKGIGARVLEELVKRHPCKSGQSWIGFVDEKNPRAKSFFQKRGWACQSEAPDEHGMIEMRFTEPSN